MQAVSREDGGLAVDVIQCHLHAWQRADTRIAATESEDDYKVEQRAVISFVNGRVDLEVGPWGGGGG